MRLPKRDRSGGLKFNITPLIDVVFQLIIFFLAANHLARAEIRDDVQLPKAGTGENELSESERRMIVTVTHVGTIAVSQQPLDVPQFELHLREAVAKAGGDPSDFEVRLRTDERVPYGLLRQLLAACARVGVTQIKFVVLPT